MIMTDKYLTNEELERLIYEVETCDLVPAPPDLEENIIQKIRHRKTENFEQRRKYMFYCFRTGMSVVAAILIMFIMYGLQEAEILQSPDEVLQFENATDRQDSYETMQVNEYPTREEVLNKTYFLKEAFENNHIFMWTDSWNLFSDEMEEDEK